MQYCIWWQFDYTIITDLYNSPKSLFHRHRNKNCLQRTSLCKRLLIDGPALDNSINNRSLTLYGTMERYNTGSFVSGTGANATVKFSGSTAQSLGGMLGDFTGSNSFNNLEIDNASGLDINLNGEIEVSGNLLLTNGNIRTTGTNTLTITNTATNCVLPSGAPLFIGDGPLMKKINQGDSFIFPIGKGTHPQ